MPVDPSPAGSRLPTLPLVAFAAAGVEPVVGDPTRPAWVAALAAASVLALGLPIRRALERRPPPGPRAALAALLALGLAPPAIALLGRALTGSGPLLDVVLVESLRNLAVGLALLGRGDRQDRAAALASLFLVLVASARADGPWLLGTLAIYAACGCAWLARASSRGAPADRPPLVSIAAATAIVGAVVALALIGPGRAVLALAGFLPSSGGTDLSDPAATQGVNDGDMEVSATSDPQSIGFSESDLFLDSDRPTLYDAFNDVYGKPVIRKNQDRMVAVAANRVIEQERRPAENLRASRDFSTVRGGPPPRARRPQDRAAVALAYHDGPTPAHLRLVAYDRFDGRDWAEAPPSTRPMNLEHDRPGDPWFRLPHAGRLYLVAQGRHRVKIARLDSGSLPIPAHAERFRLGAVHEPSFFAWAHEGILRLAGRPIPSGNTVEADVGVADPSALRRLPWPTLPRDDAAPLLHPDVAALAREWAADQPAGWARVERVIARLRQHATLDPAAPARPDSDDVVADFLLRDRRGPDYLFATAAVLLLRELGHHARLVSGLYVDPSRRDHAAGHVPVGPDGLHVWAEVRLPDGSWTPVEPTPGYDLAPPPRFWPLALVDALGRLAADAARWWPALLAALASAAALVHHRFALLDTLATLGWRLDARLRPAQLPWRTLSLLERRLRWAGCPRPAGVTPRRWLERLADRPALIPARAALRSWLALAECHLYAPTWPRPASPNDLCARVVRVATLDRLRAAATPESPR